jgi:hypothetical protein
MLPKKQQQMVAPFETHVGAELKGDLDTTMATMSDEPHLSHVPTMAGGVGQAGVLVQIGLLKPDGLPVTGAESARKVLNPKLPPRDL